jgi:hypothetical protein
MWEASASAGSDLKLSPLAKNTRSVIAQGGGLLNSPILT